METSFKRLRVARMDLMQVHNLVDTAVHTKTLEDWKARGRVRYLGITHYTSSAYAEVERWLKTGKYDFLQINYSLGERESEARLLPLALEKKDRGHRQPPVSRKGQCSARCAASPCPDGRARSAPRAGRSSS